MFKSRHTAPTSAPPSYSPPEREDGVLCFTSRDHLLAWHNRVHHEQPCALREVNPQSLGAVCYNLAVLAAEPHGGTLLMLTPPGSRGLDWLREVREEHARDAISGPHKIRMEGEPAVLIGVASNAAPTFWDHLETEEVEVGELLIRFGRAQAALERQARAAATMGDLLLGLSVSVRAVETDDA